MENMEAGLQIERHLNEIAAHSMIDGGIWRATYTDEFEFCRQYIKAMMTDAGLSVYEDAIGDIYGRVEGTQPGKVRMFGSHLDTVQNGGKYDGIAGVVTAIQAVKDMLAENGQPEETVEIVGLTEEEGSRFFAGYFGSRAMVGMFPLSEFSDTDANGISIRDAMLSRGYHPDDVESCRREDIASFVELHIEQGPLLEKKGITIGAVQNIVGVTLLRVTVSGEQNHAGTTPMDVRLDPAIASFGVLSKLREDIVSMSPTATFTVGVFGTKPGLHNVVPAEVTFTIDLRDGNQQVLDSLRGHIETELHALEKAGFKVDIELQCNEKAANMTPEIVDAVYACAEETGHSVVRMNSGAGHDTQVFAQKFPTGMIFVPSHLGVSHSPDEYTSPADLQAGYEVLKQLMKKLCC